MGQASASNWAQVTGPKEQNIARSKFPSAAHPHWQPRYGHTVVKYSNTTIVNDFGSVILMGGDVYDADYDQSRSIPNLLDVHWGAGFKNDIWLMGSTDWEILPDRTGWFNKHGQKLPRVFSSVTWSLVNPGYLPPPRISYDNWIVCQDYFSSNSKYNQQRLVANCAGNSGQNQQVMWSPRRHHASVNFNGYIWVMGGRARELVEFSEGRSVGGIIGPRVKDVDGGPGAPNQPFTTQREAGVVKSDVWRSADGGAHWTLVTPGCKAPQALLIPDGNTREGKHGESIYACTSDADCYGAEHCDIPKETCVCDMWTSREQHAVAVYGDYIYISGGYASYLYSHQSDCGPYPCGDTDASSYRYYLSDVWRSRDGVAWELVTPTAAFSGRGSHQMLAFTNALGVPYLWIFGGRGGDNSGLKPNLTYFGDIWVSPLASANPMNWTQLTAPISQTSLTQSLSMPWSARMGHTVTLDEATAGNGGVRTLFLMGGRGADSSVLDDTWAWRLDEANSTWIQDFTNQSLYSTVYDSRFGYFQNSPIVTQYLTAGSDISLMQRYFVPSFPVNFPGKPLEKRNYLTPYQILMLRSVGINTINDLATADKYTILKLRGFDIPQVPKSERLAFNDVCDYRALAIALIKKCNVSKSLDDFYEQRDYPQYITPLFGGAPPYTDPIAWHGSNYQNLFAANQPLTKEQAVLDWDGCTFLKGFSTHGYGSPNVLGIGLVDQVSGIRDPYLELENLECKQTPGARAHHAAVSYKERLYIFGGKSSDAKFNADSWYRDSNIPNAFIQTKPSTSSSESSFVFTSNKPGCYFEYRIWDPANYRLIREWTPVVYQTDIAWMDSRRGGPGTGLYAMYVRAVDPAGNRDIYFSEHYNVYTWIFVDLIPWDIIFGAVGGFLGLCIIAYIEYRRRRKKAAMERYALKRMRRKFKAMQKDADEKGTDWRTLYEESKLESAATKRKKMLKRAREANKERLEKDAQKRDKEKDIIKLKMKEKKDMVRKKRLNDGGQYGFGERTDDDLELGRNRRKNKVLGAEDLEGPSRVKKSKEKRRKPGGYDPRAYEQDGAAAAGSEIVLMEEEGGEGVKKRNKVANKRTKEFQVAGEDGAGGGDDDFKKDT